jgi:hypothetical protein
MTRSLYFTSLLAVLLASSVALAACAPTASPVSLTPILAASAAPENTPTVVPAITGAATSQPTNPASLTITFSNDNQSIILQAGQRFLLQLGDAARWTVNIDNQDVVSRVMNMAVVKGAQGVFEAHKAGQALLSAVGTPVCPAQGVCSHLAIGFALQITVQ